MGSRTTLLVLGCAFEIGATLVGTVGKQLVSYSARVGKEGGRGRMLKINGLTLTTLVGPLFDIGAYALAPQELIAPLGALDIVWNTMSAPFTLGERLSRRHAVGTFLVFVGATGTSILGPHHDRVNDLAWLEDVFLSWRFLAYAVSFGGLMLLCILVLLQRPKGVGDKARGVALGVTAGSIAGNMFFMSAGLGTVVTSISSGDWSPFSHLLPYLVLSGGIGVAITNIPFMTKGLQEFEALFMVTLFEGCHVTVACITGAWVLREFDGGDTVKGSLYGFCVLIILLGLLIIQSAAVRGITQTDSSTWLSGAAHESPGPEDSSEEPSGMSFRRVNVVWAGGVSGIHSAIFAQELSEGSSESDEEAIVPAYADARPPGRADWGGARAAQLELAAPDARNP